MNIFEVLHLILGLVTISYFGFKSDAETMWLVVAIYWMITLSKLDILRRK